MSGRMTTAQAASALGVRASTVYAYVSRGLLHRDSEVVAGRRLSFFDRAEVLALAAERARPRAGMVSTLIESDVTALDPRGRLAFRGRTIDELVTLGFEQAADVVWQTEHQPWPAPDPRWGVAAAQVPSDGADLRDRMMLALTLAGAADPERSDLGRDHVLAVARRAIHAAVGAVGAVRVAGEEAADHRCGGVAAELWQALAGRSADPAELLAIETALVVLMDHELAASTLAVRVAASTRSDPWSCLQAGLAVLRGPRHGGAGGVATDLLRRWMEQGEVEDPPAAGFGHAVYESIDPRAELLLDCVGGFAPEIVAAAEDLATTVLRRTGHWPNIDLALAALTVAGDLPEEAPAVIFSVARMVGWAAHMLEEQPHGLRFRPRAVAGG